MADQADALSPQQALQEIAGVAGKQVSLRSRLEGMAWILWGLVAALQSITFAFTQAVDLPEGRAAAHLVGLGSHLWIFLGIAASVGIWRAAAVDFDPGVSRHRGLAFFIAWPALFTLAILVVTLLGGAAAFAFAAVTTLLLTLFALANPVRFTTRGRWTAVVLALVSALVTVGAWVHGDTGPVGDAVVGSLIGLSWVLAGLHALYQG
jgi:hypothetical protein